MHRAWARKFGKVDGIVNCVGSVLLKPAHLTTPAEWHETLAVNLTSAFATVRAGHKVMRKSGGSIILMSTAAARVGLPNHEAIAAAKAGVHRTDAICSGVIRFTRNQGQRRCSGTGENRNDRTDLVK